MEDFWDDVMGERKSPKDLLRLVIKTGGISASEAAASIKVGGEVIGGWVKALAERKFVTVEGDRIRPTAELLERLRHRRGASGGEVAGEEARPEAQATERLQSELEEKTRVMDELSSDILSERKLRADLDDRVEAVRRKTAEEYECTISELKDKLARERAEREKVESLLRRKIAGEEISEAQVNEAVVLAKPEYEPPPPVVNEPPKEAKVELPQPVRGEIKVEVKVEHAKPKESPTVPPQETARTSSAQLPDPDALAPFLKILAERGPMDLKSASKSSGIGENVITGWLKYLMEAGAVEEKKRMFGGVQLALKKGAVVEKVIEDVRVRNIREEIARLRGSR